MMDTMTDSNAEAQARVDAAMAHLRDATRTFLTTPCAYTLTGYSETPSRNGVAWDGILRKNGVEVGRVHDAGVGGMADFEWSNPEVMADFVAEANARYGDDNYNALDDFANDLATAAQYNRARSILFVTDDDDLTMGECRKFRAGVTMAQAKAALLDPARGLAGKNPMVWDKSQSMFVPVADIDA